MIWNSEVRIEESVYEENCNNIKETKGKEWEYMLEIVVVFGLYALIQRMTCARLEKKIRALQSMEVAVTLRTKLVCRRKIVFRVFLAIYLTFSIVLFLVSASVNDPDLGRRIAQVFVVTPVFLWIYLRKEKNYRRLMGNVSELTKDRFLEHYGDRFALYLRGFSSDDYMPEAKLRHAKGGNVFSEYKFVNILGAGIPVCAVGRPNETDAPFGATRIYVSDETWRDDAAELIRRAVRIYILVNDRESCLWEIETCAAYLDKVVLIANDIDKYENARMRLAGHLDLPELSGMTSAQHFYLLSRGDWFEVRPYENSIEGYCALLGDEASAPYRKKLVAEKRKMKRKKISCLVVLLLPVVLLIVFFVILNCVSR